MQDIIDKYSIITITSDSNEVPAGSAFVAIKGFKFNGNDFIQNAVIKGANLIITDDHEAYLKYLNNTNIILVENSRKTLAEIAVLLYKAAPSNLLAVTGTSGKSSTVHYIAQFLAGLGNRAATIGTLGVRIYNIDGTIEDYDDQGLTTPDVVSFNITLAKLKQKGIEYCAIEASSIGLDQFRIYGRIFKVTGFTSFSQDHLDYHQNMETYLEAKLKLFDEYTNDKSVAIINSNMVDYPKISNFLNKLDRKYFSVGNNGDYQIQAKEVSANGQKFELLKGDNSCELFTKIIGSFQISNISIALLMVANLGFNIKDLIKLVPSLNAPAGRLEKVEDAGKGSQIFIDYSHKPDALENVLKELKDITIKNSKKLFVVFGCGGNRDKIKRPLMGEIAAKYADIVIVTDDNPRHENPATIRKEIIQGAGSKALEISDRKAAIKYAITSLSDGDILLIAGKGHENYQIIEDQVIPFSDKEVALKILNNK